MNIIFIDSCILIDYINGKLSVHDNEIKNYDTASWLITD